MKFTVEKRLENRFGRAGTITTAHGSIHTPAFVVVGTKATVKALTSQQVADIGAQAVLANTYHLYLEPGERIVEDSGGLGAFMGWSGPTFTDSGGFQVLSLGAGLDTGLNKFVTKGELEIYTSKSENRKTPDSRRAVIDEDGVTFRSHIDGSAHRFTPEKSIEIQNSIGADIIFAFDECTAPTATHAYQKEAMERTHRWAARSIAQHQKHTGERALFGVVQGGPHQDLREESARVISGMDFDGYGIGGSYTKEEMGDVLTWVNAILPEEKPRHLLGIGEPQDFFLGIENGADTFDCVAPTRMARNGGLYTKFGKINILNAKYRDDFSKIEENCSCYTCTGYTKAYVAHLFRAKEMLGATLATIHNLHFTVHLVEGIRSAILQGRYDEHKKLFLSVYTGNS